MTVPLATRPEGWGTAGRTDSEELAGAADVLRCEADALGRVADSLDGHLGRDFSRVVDAVANGTGRVVLSGMGKSGLVGRKIAATLASTGTPALFVHPAEASHGDLGMVLENDIVLAISNSGETAELADLIAHCRRFGLTLIALTSRPASSLAVEADIVLLLPDAPEACPMGLAPTTSTTMQMALGDALAVTLLRRRGFTARDFGLFHPGGRLGHRLRRVRDLMHTGDQLPLAGPDLLMSDAVPLMTRKSFGCLGIVAANGSLEGIITDGDLRRAMDRDLRSVTAGAIMTRAPRTIGPMALAAEALHLMNAGNRPITSLFVVDEQHRPLGILHVHDLLRAGIA